MKTHLLDYFEETERRRPGDAAVVHNKTSITFSKLKSRAQQLAAILEDRIGKTINVPVAVFLPKEINTVIADLGIMYSCNPFMNLDVKTPKERIMNIFGLIKPAAVITKKVYKSALEELSIPVIFIDEVDWNVVAGSVNQLAEKRRQLIDTDPFCIINTSGSTGTPKGVVLNHRSFFDFMAVSNENFGFDGSEILGSLSPVVFDIFDFELCMMMVNGSQIVLLDAFLASFPVRLLEALAENHVSFIFWVPSIMVNIANLKLLEHEVCESLRPHRDHA